MSCNKSYSEESESDESESIGPKLPLHLLNKHANTTSQHTIGPALPHNLKSSTVDFGNSDKDSECSETHTTGECTEARVNENYIGPQLPPHLRNKYNDAGDDMYGPALPPTLSVKNSKTSVVGPALPPDFKFSEYEDEDEDNGVYGPLPLQRNVDGTDSNFQSAIDKRAQLMKQKLTGEDDDSAPRRERWMLELPEEHAVKFGLGSRQFRKRETGNLGDRSVWTDTPEDKERKKSEKPQCKPDDDLRQMAVKARDSHMQHLAESCSKTLPSESLLETHQKELKKKRKKELEEGKPNERRPFDRNIDLHANQLNEEQKRGVFKMARLLNDRFSSGESKYL